MRMNVFTYTALILVIIAVMFYVLMEAVLGDDVPLFVKLIMPAFFTFSAIVCLTMSRFTGNAGRGISTEAFSDQEPQAEDDRCPLCYTKTDAAVCPRCGNRL